jgi:peptidoglycan/LPS O-acetylase OafA/YrhL
MALVGVASYSLYVWHLPIIEATASGDLLALAVPLSLVAAFASYVAVESPFLRLRRRGGRTHSCPADDRPPTLGGDGSPPRRLGARAARGGARRLRLYARRSA